MRTVLFAAAFVGMVATNAHQQPPQAALATDPLDDEHYAVHLLAVGDWGVTLDGTSSVKFYEKEGPRNASYYRNYYAQRNVATLMGQSAERLKPAAVLGHGDSFYWSGIGPNDTESRFLTSFEQMYDQKSLQEVPWFNVMGNHDYGGAWFICDEECRSVQHMLEGLDAKFRRQQKYKSPYNDRWLLRDHYYVETIIEETTGMSVEIYNVDMNAADKHGRTQICCQCKSYRKKMAGLGITAPDCHDITREHPLCAGGNTQMYDTCMNRLQEWQDDSLRQLVRDTKASNATWKIVHSHYGPHQSYNDGPVKQAWLKALQDGGVQLFINGHIHAEAHEYADFKTHFITNGAGGGSQSAPMLKLSPKDTQFERIWTGPDNTYGFFELSFAPKNMRAQFITFARDWVFDNETAKAKPKTTGQTKTTKLKTKTGSSKVGHCYLIPVDGSKGTSC